MAPILCLVLRQMSLFPGKIVAPFPLDLNIYHAKTCSKVEKHLQTIYMKIFLFINVNVFTVFKSIMKLRKYKKTSLIPAPTYTYIFLPFCLL